MDKLEWTDEQNAIYEQWRHLLNAYWQEKKIWNDKIRDYMVKKFECKIRHRKADHEYPQVLIRCLYRAHRDYWCDIGLKKKREKKAQQGWWERTHANHMVLAKCVDAVYVDQPKYDEYHLLPSDYVDYIYSLLSQKQQEYIYYRFFEGYSNTDIALMTGNTRQNVNDMWQRIKRKFENMSYTELQQNVMRFIDNG